MRFYQTLIDWLEVHWVAPAYSGWLLSGLAIFFFGAATNTMAGWLYVMSGVMFALLAIGALLPRRALNQVDIQRLPINPISAGELLTIGLTVANLTAQAKTLIQIKDILPSELGQPPQTAIEIIPPRGTYHWVYEYPAVQRGIYRWRTVQMRTAAPVGLFWHRRNWDSLAKAVVYPTVLSLSHCPLVDELGQVTNTKVQSMTKAQGATEGVTRTLRPYRWGDPTRLVHWRTSARFGELRVRELEVFTGGQEVIVCLDNHHPWQPHDFEQAVTATASLYFYALRRGLRVSIWTAGTGQVRGDRTILETLAEVSALPVSQSERHPELPLLWLSANPNTLNHLPTGSRWIVWADTAPTLSTQNPYPGLLIQSTFPLQPQLQSTPKPI